MNGNAECTEHVITRSLLTYNTNNLLSDKPVSLFISEHLNQIAIFTSCLKLLRCHHKFRCDSFHFWLSNCGLMPHDIMRHTSPPTCDHICLSLSQHPCKTWSVIQSLWIRCVTGTPLPKHQTARQQPQMGKTGPTLWERHITSPPHVTQSAPI